MFFLVAILIIHTDFKLFSTLQTADINYLIQKRV